MAGIVRFVSVIVPSYNPGAGLQAQLAALDTQDYVGGVEVIVADNGSRDDSTDAAREWAASRPHVHILDAGARRGPGAARNAGVRAARGDLLAFCDADDVVSPGWLRALVESARDADLVAGRHECAVLNHPTVAACHTLTEPGERHLGFLPIAAGSNLAVWRSVFEALGGFEEDCRTGEDVAFAWRAQLSGYVYRTSTALAHKRLPADRLDTVKRFFRYGIGDAWLYREFVDAGMPRRTARESLALWRELARGFPAAPPDRRLRLWTIVLALSLGRLAGSARYRVLFA
jgi:glycosyltransferase involved in cell wall biosynthesis